MINQKVIFSNEEKEILAILEDAQKTIQKFDQENSFLQGQTNSLVPSAIKVELAHIEKKLKKISEEAIEKLNFCGEIQQIVQNYYNSLMQKEKAENDLNKALSRFKEPERDFDIVFPSNETEDTVKNVKPEMINRKRNYIDYKVLEENKEKEGKRRGNNKMTNEEIDKILKFTEKVEKSHMKANSSRIIYFTDGSSKEYYKNSVERYPQLKKVIDEKTVGKRRRVRAGSLIKSEFKFFAKERKSKCN